MTKLYTQVNYNNALRLTTRAYLMSKFNTDECVRIKPNSVYYLFLVIKVFKDLGIDYEYTPEDVEASGGTLERLVVNLFDTSKPSYYVPLDTNIPNYPLVTAQEFLQAISELHTDLVADTIREL